MSIKNNCKLLYLIVLAKFKSWFKFVSYFARVSECFAKIDTFSHFNDRDKFFCGGTIC